MENLYLIQTGTFTYPNEIDGIDSIIDLTLMGAAEFEIETVYENGRYVSKNPLNLSLKRILKNRENYNFAKITRRKNTKGEQMYVYCKTNETEETIRQIRELIKKDYTCKRSIYLTQYFKRTPEELDNPFVKNFWWDIHNDFFIFFGEEKMKMLNSAMNNLYEKWKDEFKPKEKASFMKKLLNIFKKK